MASNTQKSSSAHEIAFAAMGVALMAVSAWVTIPVGPVPFTLQTMAAAFIVVAFPFDRAILTMVAYVVLGGIGLPLFSGMRGGPGVLFGPTGGFIIALIPAAAIAGLILRRVSGRGGKLVACYVLVAVMYVFGWAWLMVSASMSPAAAFAAACAPFIVPDVVKVLAGVGLAEAVALAVPSLVYQSKP